MCIRDRCETIKDFSIRAADTSLGQGDREFSTKCQILKEKLDMLLCTLQDEELALVQPKSQVCAWAHTHIRTRTHIFFPFVQSLFVTH